MIAVAETGIDRIRFYSSSPRDYSESTIQAMLDHPNIMPALHLPVQSGSNEVLRRMARGYTVEQYKEVFDRLKSKIPNITFTTDLIVGFPQETDDRPRRVLWTASAFPVFPGRTFQSIGCNDPEMGSPPEYPGGWVAPSQ